MSNRSDKDPNLTMVSRERAWDLAYSQMHPRWRGPSDLDLNGLAGKVLDLGCGDGKTTIALVHHGLDVVGMDLSGKALAALSKRLRSDRLSLVHGDSIRLPFATGSFAGVIASHVIDHLLQEERPRAVEEMRRVLRPNGLVVGRFLACDDVRFGEGREVERYTYLKGNGVLNHYFTEGELLTLFSGFRLVAIDSLRKPTKFSSGSGHRAWITARWRK